MVSEVPAVSMDACFGMTEAARVLGVSRSLIYKLVRERLLSPKEDRRTGRPFLTGRQLVGYWKWVHRK